MAANQTDRSPTMLRKLVAFAITTGLAKTAWDHYKGGKRRLPADLTDVIARPVATADPAERRRGRKLGARRRKEGPSS
jgi:hypothetical protein